MAFVTPTDVATGEVLTASRYNQDVVENFTQLDPLFSAWTTFTPTLSASGGGLNLGSTATQAAAFRKIGKVVWWRAQWATSGSGIAGGTGQYQFTLPAGIGTAAASGTVIGSGAIWGGSGDYGSATAFMSSTSVVQFYASATPALVGSGSYGAAANWFIRVAGCFEAA